MPSAAPTRTDSPLVPMLVCAFAIFLLCIMDAAMKSLTLAIGVYSAVLARSVLATLTAGSAWSAGSRNWPERHVLKLHVLRAATVGCILILFFWGLARLPLAEAIALSFIAPIIALFMAAVLLGEQIHKSAIWASAAGLAGVTIILAGQLDRQGYGDEAIWGALAVVASAFFYAYNLILARRQALVAGPIEIAFFQNLSLVLLFMPAIPWLATMPTQAQWPLVVAATVLSLSGLLLMSWAYARAEAQKLIPMEYTAFVWSALIGWFVFHEALTWTTVAGAALIIAGCIVVLRAKPALAEPMEATP